MTDDKITISRSQYETWVQKLTGFKVEQDWEAFKAFTEKKERREFWLSIPQKPGYPTIWHADHVSDSEKSNMIHVAEVFPNDIPRMTKDEAWSWIANACNSVDPEGPNYIRGGSYILLRKALGLEPEGEST